MASPLVLTLSLRWPPAPDAFSAACVCKKWRDSLQSDKDESGLWKQVCENTHYSATQEICKTNPNADFRELALSLGRGIPRAPENVELTINFGMDNFFAAVELYRSVRIGNKKRRTIVSSFTCPVGYPTIEMKFNDDEKGVLKGVNPCSPSTKLVLVGDRKSVRKSRKEAKDHPLEFALADAVGGLCCGGDGNGRLGFKVILFRRDSMKSTCVMNDTGEDDCYSNARPVFGDDRAQIIDFRSYSDELDWAANDAGSTALRMMHSRGYGGLLLMDAEVKISPKLEPDLRSALDENDRRALCRIRYFEFALQSCAFQFRVSTVGEDGWNNETLDSKDDFLIALEGLRWH